MARAFCHFYGFTTYYVVMLTRSRIMAIFALLIGTALIALGALLPVVAPATQPLPLDLRATTLTMDDPEAEIGTGYLNGPEKEEHPIILAPVTRQFHVTQSDPSDDKFVSVRVGASTHRKDIEDDLDSLLSAEIFSYRVDRRSGAAVGDSGQIADFPATPPHDTPMEGNWIKFPEGAEQTSYDYYDYTLRRAMPAEFDREETRQDADGNDVTVNVYKQQIPPTNVAEKYGNIRNQINIPEGVEIPLPPNTAPIAQLFHSAEREIVVEPKSGLLVGMTEHTRDEYMVRDEAGILVPVQLLLDFNGKSTPQVESQMLTQASKFISGMQSKWWSVALLVLGVIVTVVSLYFAFRPRRSAE